MNRLSSYSIYAFFCFPVLPIAVIYYNYSDILKVNSNGVFSTVFCLAAISYFSFFLSRSKRVFYENTSLYVYNLFSEKKIVLNKANVGGIGKYMFLTPLIWKILYYDENNNAKYVYFIRNALCPNFDDIVEQFN
jgi:hypothetical protein